MSRAACGVLGRQRVSAARRAGVGWVCRPSKVLQRRAQDTSSSMRGPVMAAGSNPTPEQRVSGLSELPRGAERGGERHSSSIRWLVC